MAHCILYQVHCLLRYDVLLDEPQEKHLKGKESDGTHSPGFSGGEVQVHTGSHLR